MRPRASTPTTLLTTYFVARYRQVRERFAEWISAEQANGQIIAALPPETLAIAMIALLDGVQLQAQLEPGSVDTEQVVDDIFALLGAS